jgi:hypothetical protein
VSGFWANSMGDVSGYWENSILFYSRDLSICRLGIRGCPGTVPCDAEGQLYSGGVMEYVLEKLRKQSGWFSSMEQE